MGGVGGWDVVSPDFPPHCLFGIVSLWFSLVWFGKICEPEPEPTQMVLSVWFRVLLVENWNQTKRTIRFGFAGIREPDPKIQSQGMQICVRRARKCKRMRSDVHKPDHG